MDLRIPTPAYYFSWKFQRMLATNTGYSLPRCLSVYFHGGWDVHRIGMEALVDLCQLHIAAFMLGLLMSKSRKLPSRGKVKCCLQWRARIQPAGNFIGILENSKHTVG